jgi:hypothetical protein
VPINSQAFKREHFPSHLVGALTYIMWSVPAAGDYVISAWVGDKPLREIPLKAGQNDLNSFVHIDVATPKFTRNAKPVLQIGAKGTVIFYCSGGFREFRITVAQKGNRGEKKVFDSEHLSRGNHFVLIPIVVGKYDFALGSKEHSGTITVQSSPEKKIPASQLEPKQATVTDRGLSPDKMEVRPGQPVVLEIQTSQKFEITLLRDKPTPKRTTTTRTA